MMRLLPALLASLLLASPAAQAQAPARPAPPQLPPVQGPPQPEKPMVLRIESTVTLRGPGGRWGPPVVDDLNRRLYLPRGPAGLTVLSLDGFRPVAEVPETAGSAAVALDFETLRGFSANALEAKPGGPNATGITVFDLRGHKPVPNAAPELKALAGVRHILYDAATKQVAAGGDEGKLTLIDPAKLTVTATLALEGKRISAMATDRRGRLFVALADRDAIAVVNLVSREVAVMWKPEGCRLPAAMLFDTLGMRLIVACRGARPETPGPPAAETIVVIDPLGGRVVGRLSGPPGVEALIHDPVHRNVYATSAGAASASVYRQADAYRYDAAETVGTRPLAGLGAADARTGRLILATADYALTHPGPTGAGGGMLVLANTYTLLVMKRLPLE